MQPRPGALFFAVAPREADGLQPVAVVTMQVREDDVMELIESQLNATTGCSRPIHRQHRPGAVDGYQPAPSVNDAAGAVVQGTESISDSGHDQFHRVHGRMETDPVPRHSRD